MSTKNENIGDLLSPWWAHGDANIIINNMSSCLMQCSILLRNLEMHDKFQSTCGVLATNVSNGSRSVDLWTYYLYNVITTYVMIFHESLMICYIYLFLYLCIIITCRGTTSEHMNSIPIFLIKTILLPLLALPFFVFMYVKHSKIF